MGNKCNKKNEFHLYEDFNSKKNIGSVGRGEGNYWFGVNFIQVCSQVHHEGALRGHTQGGAQNDSREVQ